MTTSPRASLATSPRTWTWAAVLMSLGVCLVITWLHYDQEDTVRQARRLLTNLREARTDLARGFLYFTRSDEVESPFRREDGLALLDHAIAVLENTAAEVDLAPSDTVPGTQLLQAFRARSASFRKDLAAYSLAEVSARRGLEPRVDLAFHDLDRLAQRVDAMGQSDLNAMMSRLDRQFTWTLVVAVLPLAAMCVGVYLAGRRQQAAVEALRASERRLEEMNQVLQDSEGALRRSEQHFRSVVELSPVAMGLVGRDGAMKFLNHSFTRLFGYELQDVPTLADWWRLAYPKEDYRRLVVGEWSAAVDRSAGPERSKAPRERFVTGRGGNVLVVELSSVAVSEGVLVVFVDLTKRKQAEAALQASEERLRLAVETAGMGTWDRNVKTGQLFWSPEMQEMMGFEQGTFPGTEEAFAALLHPDCLAAHAKAQERARTGDGIFQAELHFRLRDGRERWGLVRGRTSFDAEGRPERIVGVDIDLTERKRLEAQLRQAQKLEAVGQLAGGVAHDFNNLLAGILMQIGMLQMSGSLTPEVSLSLRDLERQGIRSASLVRQLLMFSRRSVLSVKPLDLNEVLKDLLKMLGRLIGEQIQLVFEGWQGNLPPVSADVGMIEQVVMNFVVNARDAMPQGGRITLRTGVQHFSPEDVLLNADRREGRFVCLAVADTGTGMDRETMERIFEPFFTTKEPGKGTGLGLATVHGIIAQHEGWVEVESLVGGGTTFRAFLPAVSDWVSPAQEAPPVPLRRGRETILLVEDELVVRQGVGRMLRSLGYTVFEAENGKQATDLWHQHEREIDLLFTDMVMPEGMSGLDLVEKFQAAKPTLKVIISSGYSAEIAQAGGLKQSGVVFLPKPFQSQGLSEALRRCLERNGRSVPGGGLPRGSDPGPSAHSAI